MNPTFRFSIPTNMCLNLKHTYISCQSTPVTKTIPKSTSYKRRPDPKKAFDEVIERMKRKNEQALERVEDCLCDCDCGCKGQCPCDEEDYCVGNHIASYESIRYYINLYYGIMDYKERIELNEYRKERVRIEREKQERFDREIEEMKRSGIKFVTIPAKLVYK